MTDTYFIPPVAPSQGTANKPKLKLLEAMFGDGYTQTVGDGVNNMRAELSLTWEFLQPWAAAAIINYFNLRGGVEPFYYTPSDETTPILWSCNEWSDRREQGGLRTVNATFKRFIA
jgi:phage-related protein